MPDAEKDTTPLRDHAIDRRAFLGGLAAAAGMGFIPLSEIGAASPERRLTPEELAAWKKTLFDAGERILYRSGVQPHAAMPVGGIGCGNVYLDVGGHLRDWLIFNNVEPVQVPAAFFAVRAQIGDRPPVARVLQTTVPAGLPAAARIAAAEMAGEYPRANLTYQDPDLPIAVSLEAFSPWVPLEARASAYPGALFRFRIRNPNSAAARVSLAAVLANPAGLGHPGGNFNEVVRRGGLTSLRMGIRPGRQARLKSPLHLLANVRGFVLRGTEAPRELRTAFTAATHPTAAEIAGREGREDLIWLEDLDSLDAAAAGALREAVDRGATLFLSGSAQPLLNAGAAIDGTGDGRGKTGTERPDIVFEDFESGTYDRWKVEGTAFGSRPQTGTLEAQQTVSGWQGRYLVNSYLGGDGPRGKLTSQPFTIDRRFVHFLIGGGNHPGETCMNLVVDGKVLRAATGRNNERLERATWEVRDLSGRQAVIEIVDDHSGGWGHVNVDQIVFSDAPAVPVAGAVREALRALLPAAFSALAWPAQPSAVEVTPGSALPGYGPGPLRVAGVAALWDLALAKDGEVVLAAGRSGSGRRASEGPPLLLRRRVGRGTVYLLAAPLASVAGLSPAQARAQAIALLAAAAGSGYTPGQGIHPEEPAFGEICLSTSSEATLMPAWQDPAAFWETFSRSGRLSPPKDGAQTSPSPPGQAPTGALAAHATLAPGAEATVTFLLTWHFPNYYFQGARVGNRYSGFWGGERSPARAAAEEMEREGDRLRRLADGFHDAVYDSTLPYWLLDCLTSQASTIRSEVCVWLADGTFAGYEGASGCCPMNCSHVWGYEQSLAYLFPELELSMREADFKHQQRPDGGINNRIALPLRPGPTGEQPFADGNASGILKAYREHLNSPDDRFLREYWPYVRRAVDYLIALDGDPPDGIIEGAQWNTYDCAVYGPNSFIGAYYLAALRAGEEMAKLAGEPATAAEWRRIFETGRQRLVELCWNGEYFVQNYPDYQKRSTQYGPGCLADQLIGQWWAQQLGLGYLLPREHVRSALRAVFRYNWLPDMSEWRHRQRVFADQHDKGLLCCAWPKGGRPANPILYCDEVWTGVEYQVAAHMVYEGMLEEAFAIVRGARERYDGRRRNPWNEIECGGHYARAMSSWSLLLALSGFHQDGPRGSLAFDPVVRPERFKSFFSTGTAWGNFEQDRSGGRQVNRLQVRHGTLRLKELSLGLPPRSSASQARVRIGDRPVTATLTVAAGVARLAFAEAVRLAAGNTMAVELE
jgi:non-lysosomal glucosylceramidase